MSPGRHPANDVAVALEGARKAGLDVVEVHKGHRWGKVCCTTCGANHPVWSSPKSKGNHKKDIDRFVAKHLHPQPAQDASEGAQ